MKYLLMVKTAALGFSVSANGVLSLNGIAVVEVSA